MKVKASAFLLFALAASLPTSAHAILNGGLEPTLTPLTPGQVLAIGFLEDRDGFFCSGTVIRADVVLTAAHCVKDRLPEDIRFGIGPVSAPIGRLDVRRISLAAEGTDIALIELDGHATSVGGLQVIPINRVALNDDLVGEDVEIAGYGEINGIALRRFVVMQVASVYERVAVDGDGERGACMGDSGGPFLLVDDAGRVTVGGGLSKVLLSCLDEAYYTRIDLVASWVDEELAWFDSNGGAGTPSQGTRMADPWSCQAGGASTAVPIAMALLAMLVGAAARRRA